jgi:arylsulfatase A-like enzyme
MACQPSDVKYNIVFIITDQHKAAVLGCYGHKVAKTPHIDALAATGVVFDRMYCPSPLCAPSRAALVTGMNPARNGATNHVMLPPEEKLDDSIQNYVGHGCSGSYRTGYKEGIVTWGEFFKNHGFSTAAIGKMHVHGEIQKGVNPNYPEGNLMGFDESDMRFYTHFPGGHYLDYKNDPDYYNRYREIGPYERAAKERKDYNTYLGTTLVESEEDLFDFIVARKSLDYMERCVAREDNFVLHIGLEKPHAPWTTTRRFYDLYNVNDVELPANWRDWHDNGEFPYIIHYNHDRDEDPLSLKWRTLAYYACVTQADEQVGKIIAKTQDLGIYDKTIFVFTSDHGESLFEHGLFEKHCMFEAAVRIPFIISCPELLPRGVRCQALASLIDVLPTLADLNGLVPLETWEGQSLVPFIRNVELPDRQIFSEIYEGVYTAFPGRQVPKRMLLDKDYKYVYTQGIIDELYDVQNPDGEMTNLAFDPAYKDVVDRYKLMTLHDWIFTLEDPSRKPIHQQMAGVARRTGDSVELEWRNLDQVKSYIIWRADSNDPKSAVKLAEQKGVGLIDSSAPKGPAYYWVVGNWNFTRLSKRDNHLAMMTDTLPETTPMAQLVVESLGSRR